MRNALVVVAMAAGCGDNLKPSNDGADAAVVVDAEVVPDALPEVEGTWRDTFHTANGDVTQGACTVPPAALVIDQTSAQVTTYAGSCQGNGSYKIDAPGPLGTYYLRVGGVLYETNKRAGVDLSTDRLGRNDIAAISGVTFDLGLTGLQPWTSSDQLFAFGSNIGYRQNLTFTSGAPSPGSTTLNATANWSGYQIDAAKSDTLQLLQLGGHATVNGFSYASLDRVFTVPAFTMANGTAVELDGAMTTATSRTLTLNVNIGSFNALGAAAAPSVATKTAIGSAYAAVTPDVIESPPLLSFSQSSDALTTMNFGTLSFTDPFPASWSRFVKVQVSFGAPYTFNGKSGTLSAVAARVQPKADAEAGVITADLGPPAALMFDGNDAMTASQITAVPVLSWSAPALGTPTDYEVQVYEVKSTGASLTFASVLRIVTKQTSLRIPQGYLLGQRQYVFSVRARNRSGIDVYTTPMRAGTIGWSSADVLSALVTTSS